uniref:Reverse transcriptase zinc-binding domain-containing protein n=1 Tax=Ananas comosus var. bracteatus TaxID=296719 RepID=A0A6V7NH20_ANACO|nr:unnamed protein product [Ananas comosus var. bracteatus]
MPHKNLFISECSNGNEWCWHKILSSANTTDQSVHLSIAALKERISSFRTGQGTDIVYWRWNPDGRFTVSSTYAMLSDGGTRNARANDIWRLRIPLKVKVFYWLVLKKKILTMDNLVKRGWTGNTSCVLCGSEIETIDHLFTQCVFFRFLMVKSLEDVQSGDLGVDVHQLWDIWKGRKGTQPMNNGLCGIIACWWVVWEIRNGAIFAKDQADPLRGTHKIKHLMAQWKILTGR